MKILELCNYSAGIDGVFARVKEESIRLAKKGHEVKIFSSNIEKGSNKIANPQDKIDSVEIKRFSAKKIGGESFMSWNFEKEALKYNPDVIICHSYRHTHTTKALKIAKKLNCKVFLVTHAPFDRKDTRSFFANIVVYFYDNFIGRKTLPKFNKVLTITRWENPFLHKIGIKDEKIEYLTNGIPEEFFKSKKLAKEENKILFLGRIAPIKNLETVIKAMPLIKDQGMKFEIVGPPEKDYLEKLKLLIRENKIENRIKFSPAIFNVEEKIKKIDSAKIFILPSISEGMPQGLVEGMARGKITIASNNRASRDLIEDKKNGYLFPIGDYKALAKLIDSVSSKSQEKTRKQTLESVKKFSWDKIIEKIESLINS